MSSYQSQLSGLKELGLEPAEIYHNLSYDEIFDHEVKNKDGVVSDNGTMMVDTGIFTGRSPKDKYFVVSFPGRMPGIKPPPFCKFSEIFSGLNTTPV